MAHPIGVELRRQLATATSEEKSAPEGVVFVEAAKDVQLDGLQRQNDGTPVGPGLLGRAVAELSAAARSSFDCVTDYCEGDLHGHVERTLRSLPPGSHPDFVREALEACLPRIVWDSSGSRSRRAIQELFPASLPHPAPRFADLTAAQQQLLGDLAGHRHAWLIRSCADRLRDIGLPDTQEALQFYVGTHRTV
ncbi:hypothetical protein ABZ905_26005 [Streptomyces parvus]|uniref:hypothetical protein n=1 Tax=Streptomyces parvus TaxID=66428 RepID=UPI0033E4FA12